MDDLSNLMGQLGGSGQDPAAALGGIASAVQAEGGLDGLLAQLRAGGLGDAVDSWVSTGANQSVDPARLGDALGPDTVSRLAQGSGVDIGSLLPMLAAFLPQIIDMLTPDGTTPAGGLNGSPMPDLGSILGGVLGGSGGPRGRRSGRPARRARRDARRRRDRLLERAGGTGSEKTGAEAADTPGEGLPEPLADAWAFGRRLGERDARRTGDAHALRDGAPMPAEVVAGRDADDQRVRLDVLGDVEPDAGHLGRVLGQVARPGGRSAVGRSRISARPSNRPMSKSSSASPTPSITEDPARRLRTFWASGFEKT